jgi:hypothetical protein
MGYYRVDCIYFPAIVTASSFASLPASYSALDCLLIILVMMSLESRDHHEFIARVGHSRHADEREEERFRERTCIQRVCREETISCTADERRILKVGSGAKERLCATSHCHFTRSSLRDRTDTPYDIHLLYQ